jgi:hypothetical protein
LPSQRAIDTAIAQAVPEQQSVLHSSNYLNSPACSCS